MQKVAFVTYNQVGNGLTNGWHDSNGRQALILQNSRGEEWAVDSIYNATPNYSRAKVECVDRVLDEIGNLWRKLQESLSELDQIVVYVGSAGSERAIELAAQLPASKVTFVGCDCGLPFKEAAVQRAGLAEARRMLCECGGIRTMGKLFANYMETGELRNSESR